MNKHASARRFHWVTALSAAVALLLTLVAAPGTARASPPADAWGITFTASMPSFPQRGRLTLGAAPAAADGLDAYDEPAPPRFPFAYLDLYTEHSRSEAGWGGQAAASLHYRAEYQSAPGTAERIIPFLMATDRSGPVSLTWTGVAAAQLDAYNLLLRDQATGESIDLRAESSRTLSVVSGTRSFQLVLVPGRGAPTPPVLSAARDQSASEGGATLFNLGSFTDTTADGPWTVDVNWGDGSSHATAAVTAAGALPDQAHRYADNGSYPVTVQVTDRTGASASAGFHVSVANVSPSASLNAPAAADEGSSMALSLTGASDPSPTDTAAGFTYAFDCGAGAGYGSFGPASTASCMASVSGSQTVRATVRDKDGGATEYTATVVINRLPTPPVVVPGADQTATAGSAALLHLGSFTDTTADGPWTVDVNWGDGSAHTLASTPAPGALPDQPHTYSAAGTYRLTVTVTDKGGAAGTASFTVLVAPPGACRPLTWLAPADGATAHDVPVNSTFTVRFSWGDCSRFIHDESVIIQVENPSDPTTPITSWVYGRDITIDDTAGEYRVNFTPSLYGLTPGVTHPVTVFIGGQMAGQASIHLTPAP